MYKEKSEEHLEKLCCIKEKLLGWIEMEMSCGMGGENGACLKSLGELTDMVKDLSEAEADCKKALKEEAETEYYWSIVEAMKEERGGENRYGYDHYRYASSGRYAPKGHGTRYGYSSTKGDMTRQGDRMPEHMRRMGYSHESMIPPVYTDPHDPMYGQEGVNGPWYYHESEKHQGMEHMTPEEKKKHTMENMKELWHDADPELRKEIKMDVTKLVSDLPV